MGRREYVHLCRTTTYSRVSFVHGRKVADAYELARSREAGERDNTSAELVIGKYFRDRGEQCLLCRSLIPYCTVEHIVAQGAWARLICLGEARGAKGGWDKMGCQDH